MNSDLCLVVAKVLDVEERKESYDKPESWRKAWGLPKSVTYIDVTLEIHQVELLEQGEMPNCTLDSLPQTFQLRDDQKKPKLRQCLQAKTMFSGDEFLIGQWLYDIENLPEEKCNPITP